MRKLYRSTRDRKLFGVCAGLADYLGVDATLLRILLVIVTVFSGGTVLFVYIIAGFIIPRDSDFGGGSAFGGPHAGHGGWAPPSPARRLDASATTSAGTARFLLERRHRRRMARSRTRRPGSQARSANGRTFLAGIVDARRDDGGYRKEGAQEGNRRTESPHHQI
ncbi:PspC domain-containing protein [Cohnella rhizosphaerae]|uniref:PspC domain-containing protein n=1 Tax=Cohnella rhizosphaerae TaxID=1457232 RepID=A0A9X4KP96_9BACL|nr:PspC domain-containing protein [Cohnella rhizosphaerae]MDG0808564.1 PspC domain-containing protein [Cohnella rhizosphaerae]